MHGLQRVVGQYWYWAVCLVVALLCASSYLHAIKEGDLFWHIKTGEYIWNHGTIPTTDPFTYTTTATPPAPETTDRVETIMEGYWLGQLILYLVWAAAGANGIVLSRALVYFAVLLFLAWWLGRSSRSALGVLVLGCIGLQLQAFPNERPQLFAYLLAPLFFYFLERLREVRSHATLANVFPPAICLLLWANTHGSYLVGQGLVLVYLADALVERWRNGHAHAAYPWALGGVFAAGLLQPNPVASLLIYLRTIGAGGSHIREYTPTLQYGLTNQLFYPFFLLVGIVLLWLVLNWRRVEAVPLVSSLLLLALAFSGIRYVPFLLFAVPLVIKAAPVAPTRFEGFLGAGVAVALMAFLYAEPFRWGVNPYLFPQKAAQFIDRERPAGQMFNFVDWGGYLMLHCPTYQVFTDGRYLSSAVAEHHDRIMAGDAEQLLQEYGINFVVIPGTNNLAGQPVYAEIYPLLIYLSFHRSWSLVYYDEVAAIFVRRIAENQHLIDQYALPPAAAQEHVRLRRQWQTGG